jgi:Ca-activated chloride channel family protein
MTDSLSLDYTLSPDVIPVSNHRRLLYLLLEVSGGIGAKTLASNLGFVIDTSDSMHIRLVSDEQFLQLARDGQAQEVMTDGVPAYQITSIPGDHLASFPRRIDYVSEALVVASEYLRSIDRFSLIAFASRAHSLISSAPGSDRSRLLQAAHELEYMRLGDETHMAEGIAMAYTEVTHQSKNPETSKYANRIILLTDGHTKNVKACYEWAKRARQSGLIITTMGIGSEFNEDLLIPLADNTGGNAYYLETPSQIPQAFRRELGSALRISYRDVEIKLQLSSGIELKRATRVSPQLSKSDPGPDMDSSFAFLIGDFDPSTPVALLLELVVPPKPKSVYRLGQALLAWDDPDGISARFKQRHEIDIQVSNQDTGQINDRVMNIIEKVSAFRIGVKALETAQHASRSMDGSEVETATIQLRQAATRLLDMGENRLGDAMLRQAQVLQEHGSLDPDATKKLRYETRRIAQNP